MPVELELLHLNTLTRGCLRLLGPAENLAKTLKAKLQSVSCLQNYRTFLPGLSS